MSSLSCSLRPVTIAAALALHALGALAQTPGAAPPATADGGATLSTVTVEASADASAEGLAKPYAGGQVARGGRVGILGTQDVMNTPFSTTSYTHELIQDQQARSVADVLQNDPSVRVARGFGNFQESFFIRGFIVNSDDIAYNGLYGLLPRQYIASELFERVEVLRGASAFLNGATPSGGGIGGNINLLPKRAPSEALTEVGLGIATGSQAYAATDIARRFGPDQSLGIRLNAAHRDGGTGIDGERVKLDLFSVGLDWRGRNARISADIGHQEHRLSGTRPNVTPGGTLTAIPRAPDNQTNFAQPWTYSNERDTFGTVRGEFDLAPDVTAWAAAGARRGSENNSLANTTATSAAGDTSTYRFDNARRDTVTTGEVGIRGKLRTGDVGHALSATASTFTLKSRNAYAISDFAGFASNIYSPVSVAAPAADFFVGGVLSDPLLTQKSELSSIALVDTLSFAQDRLLLTVGARRQTIKEKGYDYTSGAETANYDKSAVTPVAGVVFKPMQNLSLYANYIESLTKGPVAGGTALNAGEVFAPYRSKQKEIGAKYDAGTYGMNLALFTTSQPMGVLNGSNIFGIDGEQRNRGAEFTVYGAPVRGLRLLGGLTLLDAKQRRTDSGANDGKDVIGTPDLQANLGAEWDVPGVRSLSLSGRVLHTASQYADAANTQKVPSWRRVDAGVRYVTSLGKQALTVRGQVENLTNRDYWASAGGYPGSGYLVLGAPRTLTVSATLDF